ncbi:MAG: glycoside hydrolase family 57 protein [Candidatus Calescibacterium sp.]|nr:glycoside hydrolase family 57 protein [Candidatus Calescibacterium sp.]MDW8132557.1 glycoside hydrolase family 57 protein [Candidatus Calescibacterium sp.]
MDPIYLNILWHQHQPIYKDSIKDTYTAPWVRLHATKDYYDMASILLNFPKVKLTINLTPSLLLQIEDYVNKLKDYADENSPNYRKESSFPKGKLDRALDLLFKPVDQWTQDDKNFAKQRFFDAHHESQIFKYPAYKKLFEKVKNGETLTNQEYLNLKVWFHLVWFDPDFLNKDTELIGETEDGNIIKDKVTKIKDIYAKGLKGQNFTEEDAKDIIIETYKIMKFVIPIHRYLQNKGQIEITTTPFYHPILPLIDNTDSAKEQTPHIPTPPVFKYPEDADSQVKMAMEYYKKLFGKYPTGMWPGEGAVGENIIKHLAKNGIKWFSTGHEVIFKSGFAGDVLQPYRVDVDTEFIDNLNNDAISVIPRSIHDKVGWDYGYYRGKADGYEAAKDFINYIKSQKHYNGVPENEPIYITNTCDGENVWTYYQNDGKDFLMALYDLLQKEEKIKTMTPKEYITTVKPVDKQWELEPLATGSWVYGDLTTWIGEESENKGWYLLNKLRQEFIKIPYIKEITNNLIEEPNIEKDREKHYLFKAWHTLFAAEGSDWFWWYGNDWDSGNDKYFARKHRELMVNALKFAQKAGYNVNFPKQIFEPLYQDTKPLDPTLVIYNPKIIDKNLVFEFKYINPLKLEFNTENLKILVKHNDKEIAEYKWNEIAKENTLIIPKIYKNGKYEIQILNKDNEIIDRDFYFN